MKRGIYIILFLFLLSVVSAGSVGLSPVHYKDFFEPYMERTYSFHTFNSNPEDGIKPYLKGDLAEYANISKDFIRGRGDFQVTLKLPGYIEKPGNHSIRVGVIESRDIEAMVGGLSAIEGRIDIIVPYPGVYLESEFAVSDINEGEEAKYEININNLGTNDVQVKPIINIYEENESKKVSEISLEPSFLTSKNKTTLSGKIESKKYAAGNYFAILSLEYENNTDKIKKDFRVGKFLVDIVDYSYQFEKGRINPFIVEVESKWNTKIDRVYIETTITDQGKAVGSFKTPFTDLNSWEKKNLTGYFDTTFLEPKRYTASINVFYDNKMINKLVAIYIVSPKEEKTIYYVIMVVLFIALAAIIFLIAKNKRLRHDKKK